MSLVCFVYLCLYSEFFIIDGIVCFDDVIGCVKVDEMLVMVLIDLINMFGMVKFYLGMCGKGFKFVIGCDVWVSDLDG